MHCHRNYCGKLHFPSNKKRHRGYNATGYDEVGCQHYFAVMPPVSAFGSKHRMEQKEAWSENEERLLQPLQQNVPRFARYILDYNLACILERVGTLALLFTLSFTETLVIEAP